MKYMGLDFGSKTIGVAISDDFGWTAQPITAISSKGKNADLQKIAQLITQYSVCKIVIGLPKNMDGTMGKSANLVVEFTEFLKSNLSIPILLWDERMSTQAVTRTLLEADMSRGKRKKVVDKLAAAYILQGYLDYKKFHKEENGK